MARARDRQTDMIYRIYVTDALQMIALNTAHVEKKGVLERRYSDIIHPKKEQDANEIIERIRKKLGD